MVSAEYPYLATSTDGLIFEQGTSGEGVLEIKCQVSREQIIDLAVKRKNFFLKKAEDGTLSLRKAHPYYTQVQFEMAISETSWCDFVVFTQLDCDEFHEAKS